MEVRKGYKQTEIGIIPEDWKVKPVGEISDVKTGPFGSALHEKDYVREGTPIITVEHLGEYGVEHFNLPLVSDADKNRLKAYLLRQGDVVFSRVGSVDRNALIKEAEDGWLFSGRLLRVRPDREISPTYLSYHFHSEAFKQRVRDVAVGQTMASINTKILMGVKAIFPPTLTEQEAIAEALSDADALIEAVEQLLTKKRQVKQGAMSELLTGKRRLSGFGGEWKEKTFPEICWYQEGPGVRTTQFTHSGIKLLNGTNIFRGVIDLEKTDRYISEKEAFGAYAHFLADAGDIVIASSGITIDRFEDKVAFVKEEHLPLCMNTSTIRFKAHPNSLKPSFLYFLFMSDAFKKQIGPQATGSAQLNFGPAHLNKIVFMIPSLAEQTAIAEILSDMDAEITALEEKLVKARQVKQGMMQELLTGKIRLNRD